MAKTEYTAVSLVKAYWTAQSINGSGYDVVDTGNAAVGNVSGYNYVANQGAVTQGQQITVNTTHAWNITGTTAAVSACQPKTLVSNSWRRTAVGRSSRAPGTALAPLL